MASRLTYPTADEGVEYPTPAGDLNKARDEVELTHVSTGFEEDVPAYGDPLESLVKAWVAIAAAHARTRQVGGIIIADVVGIAGAWAQGSTRDEALGELPSVLADWVWMKLHDGDRDIPAMEGVRLIVEG